MNLVVIGGGGLIGRLLVTKLDERGHHAVAASPDAGVNVVTGEGLAGALAGASVVVDVSTVPSFEDAAAFEFFDTSTRNLLAAEAAARVGHHVALSDLGADRRSESGYFRARSAQEQLIVASSITYSIVRAAQVSESVNSGADDVADALTAIAVGPPLNGIVEIAHS